MPGTVGSVDTMLVTVGEFDFEVREWGPADGRPVLLLHGFPQTSRAWEPVAGRLAAAGCRCLAPDQRGYSPGARPADVSAYGMPALVGDALGLLDGLGLDAVDVVGHDWGSFVGWQLAGRHPARVRTLTAVSVPHPAAYGWAMANDAEQQQRGSYIKLFCLAGQAEEVLLADGARWLRRIFDGGDLDPAAVDDYVSTLSAPATLTAALNWYRAAFSGPPRGSGLGPVTVPTTFVWSTADVAVARAGAERTSEYVAGDYRFVELDGISHWIPEQAPDALAEAVLARIATT